MTQAPLDLDTAFDAPMAAQPAGTERSTRTAPDSPARASARAGNDESQRAAAGFELGWDHARHGLVPPTALLAPDSAVCQGWMAGRAASGRRTLAAPVTLRRWLALRLQAWQEGSVIDPALLTPQHLARLTVTHCPVLRQPLGGAGTDPLAPTVLRLAPTQGWVPGNLAMLSRQAAAALRGSTLEQAQRQAALLAHARPDEQIQGLDASAWRRVATLHALVADALPWHQAARVPLALLPPPGVAPLHALLQLQCTLTQCFAHAGWARRSRQCGSRLPAGPLRTDWHLLVGTLATRWLEAGAPADPLARRRALEDAWQHTRVQRRWEQLALQLNATLCAGLGRGM